MQDNIQVTDPVDPNFQIPGPGQRGRGIDLNIAGQLLRGWTVLGSLTRTKYALLSIDEFDTAVSRQPRDTYSLYSAYRTSIAEGLSGGMSAGLYGRSSSFADTLGRYVVPAARQVDVNGFLTWKGFEINLGIRNIFDRRNYNTTSTYTFVPVDEPRNVRLNHLQAPVLTGRSTMIPQPANVEETRREAGLQPNQPARERWAHAWRLSSRYFVSDDWKWAWFLVACFCVIEASSTYIFLLTNRWQRSFYDAIEQRQGGLFMSLVLTFAMIAALEIGVIFFNNIVGMSLAVRWRKWLTEWYLGRWFARDRFYEIERLRLIDNPDQRIAEDLKEFTAMGMPYGTSPLVIVIGLVSSVIRAILFAAILTQTSSPISIPFFGYEIPLPGGDMIWFAIVYVLFGTVVITWIGKPFVRRRMREQHYEADFRSDMLHVRRNAEQIAFSGAQRIEQDGLRVAFDNIRRNWYHLMLASAGLSAGAKHLSAGNGDGSSVSDRSEVFCRQDYLRPGSGRARCLRAIFCKPFLRRERLSVDRAAGRQRQSSESAGQRYRPRAAKGHCLHAGRYAGRRRNQRVETGTAPAERCHAAVRARVDDPRRRTLGDRGAVGRWQDDPAAGDRRPLAGWRRSSGDDATRQRNAGAATSLPAAGYAEERDLLSRPGRGS